MRLVQFAPKKNVTRIKRTGVRPGRDVARKLRRSAGGRGGTILREDHTWSPRAVAAGRREKIPDSWRFSHERVVQLIG